MEPQFHKLALPAWVYKRDGRLVPFLPDEISLSLFNATEKLGTPNVFLARELTEGVLHFLAEEAGETTPHTSDILDLTVKVVRELGQPALARILLEKQEVRAPATAEAQFSYPRFLQRSPEQVVQDSLQEYSLRTIFSRDLQAAAEQKLITLHGLQHPQLMVGCLLGPPDPLETSAAHTDSQNRFSLSHLLRPLQEAQQTAGRFIVLDNADRYYRGRTGEPEEVASWVRQLCRLLDLAQRSAVVHLHCKTPPAWAEESNELPLFPPSRSTSAAKAAEALAERFLEACLLPAQPLTVNWHLSERDFPRGRGKPSVTVKRLAQTVAEFARIQLETGEHRLNSGEFSYKTTVLHAPKLSVTLDRPKRPIQLGPGIDRHFPALLMAVRVHLPGLLDLPGVQKDRDLFLRKLTSLVQIAVSAGRQKRAYLQNQGHEKGSSTYILNRRFLLARARLAVIPAGLDVSAQTLSGCRYPDQEAVMVGRQIMQHIQAVLDTEGKRANLSTTPLSENSWPFMNVVAGENQKREKSSSQVYTPLAALSLKEQLRVAGQIDGSQQGSAGVTLFSPADRQITTEEIAEVLHLSWKETSLVHLQFCRTDQPQQLSLHSAGL